MMTDRTRTTPRTGGQLRNGITQDIAWLRRIRTEAAEVSDSLDRALQVTDDVRSAMVSAGVRPDRASLIIEDLRENMLSMKRDINGMSAAVNRAVYAGEGITATLIAVNGAIRVAAEPAPGFKID